MREARVFGLLPLRLFYEGDHATVLGKAFSSFWAGWSALGLPSYGMIRLETVGRKSGKVHALAVVVAHWCGESFLVSMLGECAWVRNVRAHPEVVLFRYRRRRVRLEEVPVAQRAPIIQAYLRVAPGARPHIGLRADASLADCEQVAASHPVFRIVPP